MEKTIGAMAKRTKPNDETPDRVTINARPSKAQVDGYYKILNLSRKTWMEDLTPAQRYEMVLSDLMEKLRHLRSSNEDE